VPRKNIVVGTFGDAESLVRAVRRVRAEGFRVYDVYAPYPIHELDQAMAIRRSRLPMITLLASLLGASAAFTLQFYAAVLDWPLNVGGKPDNSTLAFTPIAFELTMLFGGLATVAALFLRTRLYPGKKERLVIQGQTDNVFALVLRKQDLFHSDKNESEILKATGARDIQEKEVEL